jgi:hypothetical protein
MSTTRARLQAAALCTMLCSAVLVGTATTATAAVFHACDCASGADQDCTAGNDASSGSITQPWRSAAAARSRFLSMAAGDEVRLCRGGVFESTGLGNWFNNNCRAELRCVLGDYSAPWSSGDEGAPILRMLADDTAINLANGGNAVQDGGYLIEGLHLIGAGANGNGILLFNDVDDVEMRDLEIHGFGIGVHQAGSNPCGPDPDCDGRNQRIVLRRARIHHNITHGWLGGDSGTDILDSEFESNGTRAVFDHNIYLSAAQAVGVRVLRNRLYRSALDTQGVCQATSLVVHGNFRDLRIEQNLVYEDPGAAGQGCWGITVNAGNGSAERFEDVVIAANRVHDLGNVLIGLSSCINCVIENNVLGSSQPFAVRAIAAPVCCGGSGDALMDAIVVRNNSIYLTAAGSNGVFIGSEGAMHQLSHNAIQMASNTGSACFAISASAAALAAFDRHRCASGTPGLTWVAGVGNLDAWRSQTGFDQSSQELLPGFADAAQLDFRAVSAEAAMVDAGTALLATSVDIDGHTRDSLPDIGAHEWRDDLLMRDGFEN